MRHHVHRSWRNSRGYSYISVNFMPLAFFLSMGLLVLFTYPKILTSSRVSQIHNDLSAFATTIDHVKQIPVSTLIAKKEGMLPSNWIDQGYNADLWHGPVDVRALPEHRVQVTLGNIAHAECVHLLEKSLSGWSLSGVDGHTVAVDHAGKPDTTDVNLCSLGPANSITWIHDQVKV